MTIPAERFDDSAVVRRQNNVFAADSDGGMVVLDAERGDFLHLNKTAGCIFELLDAPLKVAALRDRLVARFEVDAATCAADLRRFLAQLESLGLVEIANAGEL